MTSFNRSTSRRLNKLSQIPSIWEGDRRPLSSPVAAISDPEAQGDCILWIDGSQGIVRSMDVVDPETGPEAIVRTLMRAMEHPHSPAKPGRPQRIIVRDREIQFYLRGVLQDLDIAIDYAPELPLIDELFRGFADMMEEQVPDLPPQFAQALIRKANAIWELAPWEILEEQQILAIEINCWDVGTLYTSVMGMLGMERGVLLYRSEDSLKRFRATVLQEDSSTPRLEEAFLKQDCIFLTYESNEEVFEDNDEDDNFEDISFLSPEEVEPAFGNIHPLEGLRAVLYEEEAQIVYVALEALERFIREHNRQLRKEIFPELSRRYRIAPLEPEGDIKNLMVTVSTLPQLAEELERMVEELDDDDFEEELESEVIPMFRSLRDDLIPDDSFLSLGVVSWEMLDVLRSSVQYRKAGEIQPNGDGLPVILIQTSRPKGKTIIENIEQAGGVKAVCFNPGADSTGEERYDLGLLQTYDEELFLFGEFLDDDPVHVEARKKWNQRCKNTKGYCGVIIAKGLTGSSRGNPQMRDMMALFEARSLSSQNLGLGKLQLIPDLE
jgi:hypothetical protein